MLFTLGDPSGIGPEVVLKCLLPLRLGGMDSLGVVGPKALWELAAREVGVLPPAPQDISVIEPEGYEGFTEEDAKRVLFKGEVLPEAAKLAVACLERAVTMAEENPASTAVVTAPLNKKAFHEAGLEDPGHTEWLARRAGVETPVMLLVGGELRVALMTTHLPVRDVAASLRADRIVRQMEVLQEGLKTRFGMVTPRIAVLALNPHGGSGGEPGREEIDTLEPALQAARGAGMAAEGLFSADAFFGRGTWKKFDAVLAPYHDQGLVAVKMNAAGAGVNVTLGLPFVRTSPDHGTAFDIAGRGVASEESTLAAARLASRLLESPHGA